MIRWTPFIFLYPKAFISGSWEIRRLNLKTWSEEDYEYQSDLKYRDFAKPPERTIEQGSGDCEDYALVAASWAYTRKRPVTIAFVGKSKELPSHVVAYDGENVYSSGEIIRGDIEEFIEESEFDYSIKRKIR